MPVYLPDWPGMYTGVPNVFVMPNSRKRIGSLASLLLLSVAGLLTSAPLAPAQNNVWLSTATDWNDNASWSLGSPPQPNQVAEFPSNGNIFVFIPTTRQVGQLFFPSNAAAYTFGTGGATVALQINAVATIGIRNESGLPQEYGSGLLNLGGSQTWTTTQVGGNTIIDTPVNGAGLSLTKTGVGDLTFTSNSTLNVANFNAQGGRTVFDNPAATFTFGGNTAGTANIGTAGTAATLQLGGDLNNKNNAINPANVTLNIGATGVLDSAQGTTHDLGNITIAGGRIAGNAAGTGVNFTLVDASTMSVTGTTATSVIDAPRGVQLTTAGGSVNFSVANGFSGPTGNPDLTVNAPLSGAGALNKNGLGIMRLTASNIALSGPVNVNTGTLQLTATGGTGSGTVTVGNTATLMGNGTIGGALNVQSGGTLAPNVVTNNNPARLTQTVGNTDFASGSTFAVRIGGDNNDDAGRSQLNTTGTLTFPSTGGGTWTVDVSKVAAYTPTNTQHTYTIAQAGSIPSNGLDVPVTLIAAGPAPQTATNGTTTLRVSGFAAGGLFSLQRQGNAIVLNYNPVPEPVGILAIFGAGLGVAAWRRRSKQLNASIA